MHGLLHLLDSLIPVPVKSKCLPEERHISSDNNINHQTRFRSRRFISSQSVE